MARTEPRVIVICLGNPGPRFAGTRHNAGFLFADYLAGERGFTDFVELEGAEACASQGELAGVPALLVKPTTAMNDCGRIIPPLCETYGIDEHLYAVVHDDLDLPLGSVKGREKGGHGGHNGVRAVLGAAGRRDLVRIKLGVRSASKRDYDSGADFLLADFLPEERQALEAAFPEAADILINQVKSFLARTGRQDRREEVADRYRRDVLDEARSLLAAIPAASPYPVLLTRQQMARAFDVATALAKLLRKARVAAARDDAFYARLVDFIPEHLRPLLPPRSGSQRLFTAVDLHVDGQRMKVIELNCAVGYAHHADLAARTLAPLLAERLPGLERPSEVEFAAFLYEHGLRPHHEPGAGALAFLRGFGNEDMFNVDELERLAGAVADASGLCVPLCHERELDLRDDGLYLRDAVRVDLLYVEENLSEWAAAAEDSPVARAVLRGVTKTFPPLDMFLFTNKRFLALLADSSARRWFEPDDQEGKVIRENVPWSDALDSRVESACRHMLEQGLRLVVKDALGGGGRGVVILRPESASQQAGQVLRRRAEQGGSVVQGYFEPGRWSRESDLRFDLRILVAAHQGDVTVGPAYGRVFRGAKLSLADPDAGVAPVYVVP